METYFVALVYQKGRITMLRTIIVDSDSSDSAFDVAVDYFSNETAGFELILRSVTKK